jgi:nucleoside-diphosphate-sugar epimerase
MIDTTHHTGSTVLLTGAVGVIGRAIAEELRSCRIIGLVRADTAPPQIDGCADVIPIDLTMPRLGLLASQWRRPAAGEADVIVHSGALAQWGQPWERCQAVNVDGTARILELAQTSGAVIHYLSTAMVCTDQLGTMPLLSTDNILVSYARSKLLAERLIHDKGVPSTVYRPASVVGDSRHRGQRGTVGRAASRGVVLSRPGTIPSRPSKQSPRAGASRRHRGGGSAGTRSPRAYWLCYGEAAMTIAEMESILIEHAKQSDGPSVPCRSWTRPVNRPYHRAMWHRHREPSLSRWPTAGRPLADLSEMTQSWGRGATNIVTAVARQVRHTQWQQRRRAATEPKVLDATARYRSQRPGIPYDPLIPEGDRDHDQNIIRHSLSGRLPHRDPQPL